jgi:ADP-dependent NAD(P)H-hydrate dehydratase / NAD(P)H-hydrate epimerase
MKVFETKLIREIDEYTVREEPVSSTDLMERAAAGCADWMKKNLSRDTSFIVFTGPGNNGGDGWAIARLLSDHGFKKIQLYHLCVSNSISPDAEINRTRLLNQGQVKVSGIHSVDDLPGLHKPEVIIDALYGSGLSRSLEGLPAALVNHINASGCMIISIDIPSGLMGEDNTYNPEDCIIEASVTLTFQFPKRSFFYAENEKFVGKWHIIPIGLHPDIIAKTSCDFYYITKDDIKDKIRKRKRFSHKGTYGHALLIAGSFGMMGAAILAARACLRTGIGLLTSHVPGGGYPVMQCSVPESVFHVDPSESIYSNNPLIDKYTAVGAGPGIGTDPMTAAALISLIKSCTKPLILDADALNIISKHTDLLAMLPRHTILTPHPGEFDRIAGKSENGFFRNKRQIELSGKYGLIIILKGANSSITLPDGRCFFNSTGNAGMATAGSGDVLTGMILSLLGQGYRAEDAAIIATYMHGYAGDMAADKYGQQALIASDIIDQIGSVFKKIEDYEEPETY